MNKYFLFVSIALLFLSCQTKINNDISSDENDTTSVEIDTIIQDTEIEKDNGLPIELNLVIEYMDSIGLNTDSTRIKLLAKYAYPNLRGEKFSYENGLYFVHLNKSKINDVYQQTIDDEVLNCLGSGKGYFFTRLDSTGKAELNSSDYGCEFWEITDSCKIIFNDLPNYYPRI
jgi:hypothetical protein